jgi:ribose transport system permease protein
MKTLHATDRTDSGQRRQVHTAAIGHLWHATSRYRPVLALTIALIVLFAITEPQFRTSQNIQNTLASSAVLWIVAMGMTFAVISGGIDISVGAMVGLDGIFLAKITGAGLPQWLCLVAVLGFGAALGGLTNGLLIGKFRLSFFVVTLATMTALTGVVDLWSGDTSVGISSTFVTDLALNSFLGIQDPIWIMAIVFVVSLYLQRFTYLGRDIYATGGNQQAAKLSGIRTVRTLTVTYGIVGITAAVASVVAISQVGVASSQIDGSLPLNAIAAVVLGGTAFSGGVGGVQGTAFGVLFLGILADGLDISGVSSYWQQVVSGVILVAAVLGNSRNGHLPPMLRGLLGATVPGGDGQPTAAGGEAALIDATQGKPAGPAGPGGVQRMSA